MNETTAVHQVSAIEFDALASGPGGPAGVRMLADGQVSRRRLLICAVLATLEEHPTLRPAADLVRRACAVLDAVERDCPEAVLGRDGLLLHPFLGVWAADLLRRLTTDPAGENEQQIEARIGYLVAGAAAAAFTAGTSVTMDVVVPGAGLPVPGAGRFLLPDRERPVRAQLSTAAGELALYLDDGQRAGWQPDRRLPEGDRGRLVLDDTDPWRDTFGRPASPRCSGSQAADWATRVAAAWALIRDDYADYLPALDAGLRVITPLTRPADGHDASASAQPAYGAVGLALPPTPARLALLMLHEFQHVKLGALLDLVPMYDPADRTLHHAPWRPDPRPLGALLQGTYAHLAVTDFWRRQGSAAAHPEYGRWRGHTRNVIDVLLAAPGLNDHGRRFVAGMATTVASWDEGVSMVDLAGVEARAGQAGDRVGDRPDLR